MRDLILILPRPLHILQRNPRCSILNLHNTGLCVARSLGEERYRLATREDLECTLEQRTVVFLLPVDGDVSRAVEYKAQHGVGEERRFGPVM